jgi:hypothetical protein
MINVFQCGARVPSDWPLSPLEQPAFFGVYRGLAIRVDHDFNVKLSQTFSEVSYEQLSSTVLDWGNWNKRRSNDANFH